MQNPNYSISFLSLYKSIWHVTCQQWYHKIMIYLGTLHIQELLHLDCMKNSATYSDKKA